MNKEFFFLNFELAVYLDRLFGIGSIFSRINGWSVVSLIWMKSNYCYVAAVMSTFLLNQQCCMTLVQSIFKYCGISDRVFCCDNVAATSSSPESEIEITRPVNESCRAAINSDFFFQIVFSYPYDDKFISLRRKIFIDS